METGNFYNEHGICVRNAYGTTGNFLRHLIRTALSYRSTFSCTEIGGVFINNVSRDFKDWFTLRPAPIVEPYVIWEPYDEAMGVYHLVIRGDSPTMATGVGNTPEGNYATNDLFMEEPPNSGYWRHLGRKDDTLVM